jgi:cell division protein FtsZ
MRPAPAPQPMPESRAADPIAEAIQQAETNAAMMAQARPAQAHAEEFRPQSKLFQAPPAQPQPMAMQPAPAPQPAFRSEPQPMAAAPQRMPRVEDFPPVVKAEVEAKTNPVDHEDRGPMGLLKRLTNGLTRREDEPARLQPAQPREPKLRQAAPEVRRLAPQDPQLYAPRRGQLDDHGRLQAQPRAAHEDDQLEIPAFLRRQAN